MKKTTTRNFYVLVSILLTTMLATGQVTNGDDSGPGSLRDAVDAANIDPLPDVITFDVSGITVNLTSGPIVVMDNLVITGDASVIDGAANTGRLFTLDNAASVDFSDITFQNGSTLGDGGAIYADNTDIGILNCQFENNTADGGDTANSGGAIFTDGTSGLSITTCDFTGNTANRAGGAIEINSTGNMFITDTTFDSNAVVGPPGNGGAIHLTTTPNILISGGSATNNSAAAEGGAFWNNAGGTMTVDNMLILNNTALGADATNGGGGLFNNGGTLNVINGTNLRGNTATGTSGSGGAIFSVDGLVTVSDVVMKLNTANRAGGAIEIIDGTLNVINSTVNRNNAGAATPNPGNGGALHVSGTNTAITFTSTQVKNNVAAREGGGLWNMAGSTLTVNNSQVSNNNANGPAADDGGGAIFNNGGTLNVQNGTMIDQNNATGASGSGGGIFSTGGMVMVTDTEFVQNSATRAGGGIEVVNGTLNVTNSLFSDNMAFSTVTGIGAPGNGGAIHVSGTEGTMTTVDNSKFFGNLAYDDGGALWNQSGSTMNVQNGTVLGGDAATFFGINAALSLADGMGGGGAIYNNGGTLNVDDSIIRQNLASGLSGSGGAILSTDGAVTITNSVLRNSSAVRAGGAIEMINGSLMFQNSNMVDNTTEQLFNPPFGNVPNPGNGGGLHVSGTASVDIVNSYVTGNLAVSEGGGLWNQVGAIMTVDRSFIKTNVALGDDATNGGAGIFNNGGTLNVLNKTRIENNGATGLSGSGGGIFSTAGDVTISGTKMLGNSANRAGGAIEIIDGSLTVFRSNLNNNCVDGCAGAANPGNGGALHVTGNSTFVDIKSSTVNGNTAGREGGGLWNMSGSEMYLTRTTVDGNTSAGTAADDGGAGIFNNGGYMQIATSTISNNDALAGNGGGIHNATGGDIAMLRSTVSGNDATNGGGIFNNGNNFKTVASTVAFNTADELGGGVASPGDGTADLSSSIVSQNTATNGQDVSGSILSLDYNLIGINDGAFTPEANDLTDVNPLLGPLANNGGQTMTHALDGSSPAVNAGDPAITSIDQIGQPLDGVRDMGSFEAQGAAPRPGDDTASIASTAIGFEVYPNPSTGYATLRIPSSYGENNQVTVFELASGKMIQNFVTESGSRELNLTNFANGMYVIKIVSENETSVQRLILSH